MNYQRMDAPMNISNMRNRNRILYSVLCFALLVLNSCYSTHHKHFSAANQGHADKITEAAFSNEYPIYDHQGQTVLHTATINGNLEVIKKLLNLGMNTETVNKQGQTPLMLCTSLDTSYLKCAKLLLEHKANPDAIIERSGKSVMHFAAASNNIDFIRILLGCGAQLSPVDSLGITPLMVAMHIGNEDATNELMSHTKEFEIIDKGGRNLLTYAVLGKNRNLVSKILDKNVGISIDEHGNTPHFYALMGKDAHIFNLLCSAFPLSEMGDNEQGVLYKAPFVQSYNVGIDNSLKESIESLMEKGVHFGEDTIRSPLSNAKLYLIQGGYCATKNDFQTACQAFDKSQKFYQNVLEEMNTDLTAVEKKIRQAKAAAITSAILSGIAAGASGYYSAKSSYYSGGTYYTYYSPYSYHNYGTYDQLTYSLQAMSHTLASSSMGATDRGMTMEEQKAIIKRRIKEVEKMVTLCSSYSLKAKEKI